MAKYLIKKTPDAEGAPAWMLIYSDIVTLLLVIFVLMYSFSAMDLQRFKAFTSSFQDLMHYEQPPDTFQAAALPELSEQEIQILIKEQQLIRAKINNLYEKVEDYLKESGLEDMVSAQVEDRGVALDVKEKIMFDGGQAVLKPGAMHILDRLAKLFASLPYQILVEGHTDQRNINTIEYPSNWELSSARSAIVVRYFTKVYGLDPARFAAVGFAEYRPVAPNTSEANMALNRRVVMVINVKDIFTSEVLKGD
ncbi:MAG: OmpA family protein [Bacillota bacterium]|jgi:chemotaxis protein MotB